MIASWVAVKEPAILYVTTSTMNITSSGSWIYIILCEFVTCPEITINLVQPSLLKYWSVELEIG